MDPLAKLVAAIRREIDKIIAKAENDTDRLLLISLGERRLAELRASYEGK